jgi:hypothetical protein
MLQGVEPDSDLARALVQRSEIKTASEGETLYNQTPDRDPAVPAGQAGGKFYGGDEKTFDMTRTAGGVSVTVRILFISQARDTNQFKADGVTRNPNYLGHLGEEKVIDPSDERYKFAQTTAGKMTDKWNGRLSFVGKERPPFWEPNGKVKDVRLPVSFNAVAVFDPGEKWDKKIRVYGSAVTAGTAAGHPIDAGNFYLNKGNYGASVDAIYAHEYGHLIGLPDEYSQSNFQMHQLLHQISPTLGGDRGKELDRITVQRMVLAALTRPLWNQLTSATKELTDALSGGRAPVERALAAAIRTGASDPAVVAALQSALVPDAGPKLAPKVPEIARFQTGRNLSNVTMSKEAVAKEFDPAPIGKQISSQYWDALMAVHGEKTNLGGGASGEIDITIHGSASPATPTGIWGAGMSGGPVAGAASGLVTSSVGAAGGAPIPPVRPSDSLIAKIQAIPSVWASSSGAVTAAITPGGVASGMSSTLGAIGVLKAVAAATGMAGPGALTVRELYSRAYDLTRAAARAAAESEVRGFITAELGKAFKTHIDALSTDIREEIDRVMKTSAGATAAASPKDPNIAALVSGMQTRLAAQTPAGQTSANPLSPDPKVGSTTPIPNQEITYSNTGMMSDNTADLRTDQFQQLVQGFNKEFKTWREDPFTVEMKK